MAQSEKPSRSSSSSTHSLASAQPTNANSSREWINFQVVSGHHLPIGDLTSSDPYVIVNLVSKGQKIESHRTRVIKSDRDPDWTLRHPAGSHFIFHPESECDTFELLIYDWDPLSAHDLLGTCDLTVAQLPLLQPSQQTSNDIQQITLPLKHRNGSLRSSTLNIKAFRFFPVTGSVVLCRAHAIGYDHASAQKGNPFLFDPVITFQFPSWMVTTKVPPKFLPTDGNTALFSPNASHDPTKEADTVRVVDTTTFSETAEQSKEKKSGLSLRSLQHAFSHSKSSSSSSQHQQLPHSSSAVNVATDTKTFKLPDDYLPLRIDPADRGADLLIEVFSSYASTKKPVAALSLPLCDCISFQEKEFVLHSLSKKHGRYHCCFLKLSIMIPNLPESSPYFPSPSINNSLNYTFLDVTLSSLLHLEGTFTLQYELWHTIDDLRDQVVRELCKERTDIHNLWTHRQHLFIAQPVEASSDDIAATSSSPGWAILPREELIIRYNPSLNPAAKQNNFLIGTDKDGQMLLSIIALQKMVYQGESDSLLSKLEQFLNMISWKSEFNIPFMVILVLLLASFETPLFVIAILTGILMYLHSYDITRHVHHELSQMRMREAELAKGINAAGLESAEWLNTLMEQVWQNHQQLIAGLIRQQMDIQFAALKDTIQLELLSLDLGDRFLRLGKMKTVPVKNASTVLVFETNVEWDSAIEISITAHKPPMRISLKVNEIRFSFRMGLTLVFSTKINNPTYISRVRLQILDEQPEISFSIKPAHAAVDIYEATGIVALVKSIVFSAIRQQLCQPNFLEVALDPDSIPIAELLDQIYTRKPRFGFPPRSLADCVGKFEEPPRDPSLQAIASIINAAKGK